MNLTVFLLHFFYIFGTFIAGLAIGALAHERVVKVLNRYMKKSNE